MKIFFLVLINRLVTFLCKIVGKNGGQWPGNVVYTIDKNVLTYIKYPKYVIAVTGSSGKGSTCVIIKRILEAKGYTVAFNQYGSNGVLAACSTILNNCSLTGKFNKDVLLLECDERHLKLIFTKNHPTHLIITNLTRDQPTRNGNPTIVLNDIKKIINNDMTLVINVDDPLVNRFKYIHKGKIITFGLDKTPYDIKKPHLEMTDFRYCPICHKKLKYDFYHYGHLGSYACPSCDFKRGIPDYEAKKINLEKEKLTINNNTLKLNNNVIYEAYATTAAYALVRTLNIEEDIITKAINENNDGPKRGKSLEYKKRKLTILETKNENNLSYYQSLNYIKEQTGIKTVILGFDYVSRRYKESDLSWLYDIDFELLNDTNIDKIFLIGKFKYNILTRLTYTNIDKKKIILVEDIHDLLKYIDKYSKGDIYTMVWTDIIKELKEMIKNEEN